MKAGADITLKNSEDWNCFHFFALEFGLYSAEFPFEKISTVRKLLEGGVDINGKTSVGYTPLQLLLSTWNMFDEETMVGDVSSFIRNGANPWIQDQNGFSAMHLMVASLQIENIKVALESFPQEVQFILSHF